MRTNTPVTLYSRSVSGGSESWSRTYINAAHWENRKAANVISSGLLEADAVSVWIPDISVGIKPGDILVKGTINKTIGSTYTVSDLRMEFPYAVKVTSVDLYDFGSPSMQHLRIGAS